MNFKLSKTDVISYVGDVFPVSILADEDLSLKEIKWSVCGDAVGFRGFSKDAEHPFSDTVMVSLKSVGEATLTADIDGTELSCNIRVRERRHTSSDGNFDYYRGDLHTHTTPIHNHGQFLDRKEGFQSDMINAIKEEDLLDFGVMTDHSVVMGGGYEFVRAFLAEEAARPMKTVIFPGAEAATCYTGENRFGLTERLGGELVVINADNHVNIGQPTYSNITSEKHTYTKKCTDCGNVVETRTLGHTYSNGICACGNTQHVHTFDQEKAEPAYEVSVASCKGPATYYKSCSCGAKGSETFTVGEATEHNYEGQVITAPGCVTGGVIKYTCSVCNDSYNQDVVAAGHMNVKNPISVYKASDATCKEKAKYYYVCDVCGTKAAETYEAGELSTEHKLPLAVTYTTQDSTVHNKIETCTLCDKTFTNDEIHAEVNGTCTKCGNHNHSYVKEVQDEQYLVSIANCKTPLTYNKSCYCGDKGSDIFTVGTIGGHDYIEKVAAEYLVSEATCINKAVYYKSRSACGLTSATTFEYGEELGHNSDGYINPKAATCSEEGVVGGTYCTQCNNGKTDAEVVIEKIEHTSVFGGTVSVHTKCSVCGITISTTHTMTNAATQLTCRSCECGYETTNHTMFSTGTEDVHETCMVCNYQTTSHSYTVDSGVQYSVATCTTPRQNYKQCSCGYNPRSTSYVISIGNTIDHNYVNGTCSMCGDVNTDHSLEPGLYETGTTTLKKTWDQLVSEEYFEVENGTLTMANYGFALYGDLVLPSNITDIPEATFSNFYYLSGIVIPDGVTQIKDNTFENCESLTNVVIPESVTYIGDYAFSGANLYSISIPANVTYISCSAFEFCFALENINVNPNNQSYYSVNNCLIEKSTKTLIRGGCNSSIPSDGSVTTIGADAFSSCMGLTEIIIPNGIISIHDDAFVNCYELQQVTIPNTVTSIGDYTFGHCSSLTTIIYNGTIEQWQNIDFAEDWDCCSDNYTVYCFDGSISADGTITKQETTISAGLYQSGTNYQTRLYTWQELIDLGWITSTGYAVNSMKANLAGDLVLPDTLTSIPTDAYKNCTELTGVTIPDTITRIGDDAFYGCKKLTSITIPDSVKTIGNYAFQYCTSLKSITTPSNLDSIGGFTFRGCTSLTSIVIPDGVTTTGTYMFNGCTSLERITIPDSITKIGSSSFDGCTKLKTVYYEGTLEQWCKITFNDRGSCSNPCYNGATLYINNQPVTEIVIPNTITLIGDWTFYGCDSLTSITLPDGVTSIGNSAFENCKTLTSVTFGENSQLATIGKKAFKNCTNLINIEIPDTVTTIDTDAFYECKALTSIEIPASVTSIGGSAFSKCSGIKTAYYEGTLEQWCKISFGSYSNPCYNGADLYINGELVTDITIPSTITSIGNYAFYYCQTLTNITIPDSVTSIGKSAFSGCTNLKNVYYLGELSDWLAISFGDYGSNPCSFGKANLYFNGSLITEFNIPAGTSAIGSAQFAGCTNLTSITIPDGVTNIGDAAFNNCTNLTSINIPDSVTTIGEEAFAYCKNLKTVEISEDSQLTTIGNYAFRDCYSLTSVTIPDSMTIIANGTLSGCSSLTSIEIPAGVTSIGSYAFSGCRRVSTINFKGTMEQWNSITKNSNWNKNVPATTVTCSDGTVTLS